MSSWANTIIHILPHSPLLQLSDWLDDPEQDPIQDLDLVLVPLPQLLLHDPYDPQELHDAVRKHCCYFSLFLYSFQADRLNCEL